MVWHFVRHPVWWRKHCVSNGYKIWPHL
jgi:hypothetical protein